MEKGAGIGAGGAVREKGTIRGKLLRWTFVAAGTLFLALGVIGIFLPLLPTTPFLLLAAACYARGSQRFYNWLLRNRVLGSYIRNFREGKGIPLRAKAISIAFLWLTIAVSGWFFVTNMYMRIVLLVIAVVVSAHLLSIRTLGR
jgi:hypothetical protein